MTEGERKEEGRRKKDGSKHVHRIEQNEACQIHLNHYHGLDNADHVIKNIDWYAPYPQAQSLGIVATYDMYVKCCEGRLKN